MIGAVAITYTLLLQYINSCYRHDEEGNNA